MSVSKKHMEWAATYLAQNLSKEETASPETSITVQAFVDFFREFSPRFNSMRFAEAVRTRRENPRKRVVSRKREQYAFTVVSIGVAIDGTFGMEHAVNRMANDLLPTVARRSSDQELQGEVRELMYELDNEELEEGDWSEWLDDATDVLQSATEPGLTWEWDGGDLVLTQDVEREP